MNKFNIYEVIGKGGQGTVFRASRIDTNEFVAVKKVPCEDFDAANKAFQEMLTLQKLKHQNLVEYSDLFLDVQESGAVSVCIVMPLYADGDLDSILFDYYKRGEIIPKEVLSFTHF
jgi:serine/threonine protein kinase